MSRFLRLCAVLSAMFFTANAFAAGYVCNDIKQYTSCIKGYYMANSASNSTYNGTPKAGNACLPCPSNATFCPGGTAAPLYKVTLDFNGGQNPSGSASNAATTTVYAGADDKWYIGTTSTSAGTLISSTNPIKTPRRSGYYFNGYDGGVIIINQEGTINYGNASISEPTTLVAEWVKCPANSYCDITVENNGVHTCPSPYGKSNAGASSELDCYLTCAVGTRVTSPGDSCITGDGGWATLAHNVNYGSVSALYMPTYPFINNTSTVAMYHNANLFGNATLMQKFSGEGEPGYKLIGNYSAQGNNGFPIYSVRFTNAGDDGEWGNIVLKELVVLKETATVNASMTSPTFGIYDAHASAIYQQPGTFYISDGYIDITEGGAATDGDSNTYVSMPSGSYLVYSFGSDPVEISRIQVELGFNDDMSEFKIEVDISGNNDWVSITGNSTHDGYNQIDTSAREDTYGEPVSRTLIFPVAALQPCGNGNYKGTSPNTWNNFAQLTSCDSCADIANTNGFYQYTDTTTAGSSAQCFGTTTAGNFVEEMSKGEISCKQGYYCPGGSNVYYGSIGKPFTGGSELCPAGSYCPASTSTPSACPDNYTSDQGAGNDYHCYIMCSAGQRVKEPGGTCITDTGAWYTAANRVFYGMLSPALYAPYPFINNNYTAEEAHDFYAPDSIDASTGTAPAGQFVLGADMVMAKMGNIGSSAVRVTNKGAPAILYEISVFSSWESIIDNGYYDPYDSVIRDTTPLDYTGVNSSLLSRLTDANTPDMMTTQRTPYTSDEIGVNFNASGRVTYQFTTRDIGAVQIVTQNAPQLLVEVYSTELKKWVTIYNTSEHPTGSKPISADAVNTMILPATAWEPCSTGKYKPAISTSPIPWASIAAYKTCNSCSALDGTNGFYSKTSSTGSSAATQCFGTTTPGSAVTTANKAETQCPQNSACPGGTNVFYGSTGGSETCPVDTYSAAGATTCSACPAYTNQLGEYGIIKAPAAGCVYALVFGNSSAENNAVLENFSSKTFNSAAIQVNPDYDANSEYNKSGAHVIVRNFSPANPTAERWNIAYNFGCNAGYYQPNATNVGWIGSAQNLADLTPLFCQPAEKGYWSPGITNTTWESMTPENMGMLRNECPTDYNTGSATAATESECAITVDGGYYIKTAGQNKSNWSECEGGYYCPAGATVFYGSTNSGSKCPANNFCPTGADAPTACSTVGGGLYTESEQANSSSAYCRANIPAGSYIAKSTDTKVTTCNPGYYCPGTQASYGDGNQTNQGRTAAADGKYVSTPGATSDTACALGSYSEKSSASTKCTACPKGRTTSGTGTKYNATANTACSATCSNATGAYAWADPSWSANSVANLCTVSTCSSSYYKNSNACTLCSGLAGGFYPNSDDGNSSGTNACRTANLSGKYVASVNATGATNCANWTYKGNHTVNYGDTSKCDDCPAAPSAVNGVSWTKASGTGWSSYSSCVVSQTPANCASGSVQKKASSASAWGDTTLVNTLKSNAGHYASTTATACSAADDGYYAAAGATSQTACATGSYSTKSSASSTCTACPKGRTTSGTGTKYNATANTACSATCSNATGAYAWADPSWSANSVTNLCTINTCSSSYYKNSNACTLCSGLAGGFYPNSDDGNSSGTNACRTANLSGKYVASVNATGATNCANWTYKGNHTVNYGDTSKCDDCAATPSAVNGVSWTKASGTGWDSYSDCVVTQTPANCASGTTSRTQTNATTWGDITLVSTLKSNAGYYASTTATACSAADDGYYAAAGATSQTACATGSYSTKSSASSTCTACPKGRTTSGTGTKYNATANTACSVTCSNAGGVYSWANPSWSANSVTNLCTVSACNADTYYTEKTATGYKNTCTACGANSGNEANHTMSKCICDLGHTIDGKLGSSNTSTSGCTRISGIPCGVGQYLPAQATTCEDCDAGYYCPAEAKDYSFQDYIQGRIECALGTYQPNKKQTSCLVAEAGYHVPETAQTQQTACTGATYQPEKGKASCKTCPTASNNTANVRGYSYWNTGATGDHTVSSGCNVTFNSKTLDDGTMAQYSCYVDAYTDDSLTTYTYGVDGTSKTCWVNRSNLTCNDGYYNVDFNASSTATQDTGYETLDDLYENVCQDVGTGYWSAADTLTRTECATGLVTCGAGKCANEAADCGRKLHMGDNTIYLRSVKRTNPSLNVKVGDTTFYGALSTSLSSKAKVKNGSTTYSVVNDYQ